MTTHQMKNTLYGDGVHDDTPAIQELLDSGSGCVQLPSPSRNYLITKSLRLHSNQELRLDRWTEVVLAPKSNGPMLVNDDFESGNSRIAVTGGIWNGNNTAQAPNPQMVAPTASNEPNSMRRMAMPADWPMDPVRKRQITLPELREDELPWHPKRYWGDLMLFVNVDQFVMRDVTLRNPVTYGFHGAKITNFTFENITFDFNEGNPSPNNMDGLHFDGGCRFGRITNLKGACYDDLLAFNAEDGTIDSPFMGPIGDIEVDGVFAQRCHSCARFLSNGSPIRNITIRNVHGSFYRYAIGFTHYFPQRPRRGDFDGLVFENFFIAKALPLPSDWNCCPDYALFWGEGKGTMGSLRVSGVQRIEETTAVPTFDFEADFVIDHAIIEKCTMENHLAEPIVFLRNAGRIRELVLRDNVCRPHHGVENVVPFLNTGSIETLNS